MSEITVKEEKSKIDWGALVREAILYVILVLVCMWFIPNYVVQRTIVVGESMMTTLHNNDNIVVEKLTKYFSTPERYDVVVFYPHEGEDEYYVKRVIGLPGETVQIKDGQILINGEVIEDKYGTGETLAHDYGDEPLKLGEDEFFVMGDNRENSLDSRFETVGPIKRNQIDGTAKMRVYPFKDACIL